MGLYHTRIIAFMALFVRRRHDFFLLICELFLQINIITVSLVLTHAVAQESYISK